MQLMTESRIKNKIRILWTVMPYSPVDRNQDMVEPGLYIFRVPLKHWYIYLSVGLHGSLNKLGQALTLLSCMQEVSSLNLKQDLSCSGSGFHVILILTTMSTLYLEYKICGSVVIEALCYKPEGRGFDTR
jgi:hypothetical protein